MSSNEAAATMSGLVGAVVEGDSDKARILVEQLLKKGVKPADIVKRGLTKGMTTVGEAWDKGEAFLADVLIALDTFNTTMDLIKPYLTKEGATEALGRVVIGTVAGDIHFVGKDIVANMLEVNGFEVINLGEDVSPVKFSTAVSSFKPDILAMSCLISTSMPSMKEVMEVLEGRGLRKGLIVMVGGPPITEDFVKEIGADMTAEDAFGAVAKAKEAVKGVML